MDSSVLIGFERTPERFAQIFAARAEDEFYVSVVTASELLHGVYRARDEATRTRRTAWVESLLGAMPILPINVATARTHARLWVNLASVGAMIGTHDAWLAASAITHGFAMATLNVREFARVEGLLVEDWSQ